ncbi:glucuronate isomerase [Roseibacterium sp. SDUM158017]|uniref:glucuronate isomerase n=1 Tax=Roseicyclus salinarum TaxID=3036773 RepID=UPI00241566FC|nr:glucuronate isomerase [Roseibacterium sp. SDUM158017]MDG4646843.1 glucuronate isomerase [Roseibacterium sp. SDUM158017]
MSRPAPRIATVTGDAAGIFEAICALPIVSPHGHCDPAWWAEDAAFPDPAALIVTPDHYLFRMLHSLGVPLGEIGIGTAPADRDSAAIFRVFGRHWDAFLGTPTRMWLEHTFHEVIGVDVEFAEDTADAVHEQVAAWLRDPANRPRALFDRFGLEVLATTDPALSTLAAHETIAASGWGGRIVPTFRPDDLIDPARPGHPEAIRTLAEMTDTDVTTHAGFLDAIRARRAAFRARGATATDHDVPRLMTAWLPRAEIEALHARARTGDLSSGEAAAFHGHMLTEMAQMAADDGMVMQIHAGSTRSTNRALADRFGPDMGADIPRATNWVEGLDALLNRVGNDPRFRLIVFTLDEGAYARELAPMAGHWPALRLGPPWWFHDSLNGIRRYFDRVVETAGYRNLAGFNDDTRAFLSIPARHDLWRRGVALHLADQIGRGVLRRADADRIAPLLARDLAIEAYRLGDR